MVEKGIVARQRAVDGVAHVENVIKVGFVGDKIDEREFGRFGKTVEFFGVRAIVEVFDTAVFRFGGKDFDKIRFGEYEQTAVFIFGGIKVRRVRMNIGISGRFGDNGRRAAFR